MVNKEEGKKAFPVQWGPRCWSMFIRGGPDGCRAQACGKDDGWQQSQKMESAWAKGKSKVLFCTRRRNRNFKSEIMWCKSPFKIHHRTQIESLSEMPNILFKYVKVMEGKNDWGAVLERRGPRRQHDETRCGAWTSILEQFLKIHRQTGDTPPRPIYGLVQSAQPVFISRFENCTKDIWKCSAILQLSYNHLTLLQNRRIRKYISGPNIRLNI